MEDFTIKKWYFLHEEPSDKVRKSIRSKVEGHSVKKSLFARFRYRYVAVPVFLVFVFGGYYAFSLPSPLDREITQTQTAMNQLLTLADTEVF